MTHDEIPTNPPKKLYCPNEIAPLFKLRSTHTAALGVTVGARD